ncbi:hypothetical protein Q8A73_009290 [Channa argus]|nr:hypothetical protein Q8A73_009290 [Channa argus]
MFDLAPFMFDWSKQQMNINKKDVNMIPDYPGEKEKAAQCTRHVEEVEFNIAQKKAKRYPQGDVKTQCIYKTDKSRRRTRRKRLSSFDRCRVISPPVHQLTTPRGPDLPRALCMPSYT